MKKLLLLSYFISFLSCQGQTAENRSTFREVDPSFLVKNQLAIVDVSSASDKRPFWTAADRIIDNPVPKEAFSSLELKNQLNKMNEQLPFSIVHNPTLERFIRVYLSKYRENMEKTLARSAYYFPVFETYLDKYDLPLELKYLAVVESALDPKAVSPSGAKGLWQFMYGTAMDYDLTITSYLDERFDYIQSTDAACRYLKDLYDEFGDWSLALAAYNSGPGNVQKAIKRSGQRNYWNLRPYLPKQTSSYVPAFYAVMYLYQYADFHGLKPGESELHFTEVDTVHLRRSVSFEKIEKFVGIPKDVLTQYNPVYKKEYVPVAKGQQQRLIIPVQLIPGFIVNEKALYQAADRTSALVEKNHTLEVRQDNSHEVRQGENLSTIARAYGIRLEELKKWNGLTTNYLIAGQRLVITDR